MRGAAFEVYELACLYLLKAKSFRLLIDNALAKVV